MLAQARSYVESEIKKTCLVKRASKKIEQKNTVKFDDKMFDVLRNIVVKNLQTDKENGHQRVNAAVLPVESSPIPSVQPTMYVLSVFMKIYCHLKMYGLKNSKDSKIILLCKI